MPFRKEMKKRILDNPAIFLAAQPEKVHLSHRIDAASTFWPWMSCVDLGQHTHKQTNELPSPAIPMDNWSCSVSLLEPKNIRKRTFFFFFVKCNVAHWGFLFRTSTLWYNITCDLRKQPLKKSIRKETNVLFIFFFSVFSFSLALTHPCVSGSLVASSSLRVNNLPLKGPKLPWFWGNRYHRAATIIGSAIILHWSWIGSCEAVFFFLILVRPIAIELSSYTEREKQATCQVSCTFSSWNRREPSIVALFLEVKEHFWRCWKKTKNRKVEKGTSAVRL